MGSKLKMKSKQRGKNVKSKSKSSIRALNAFQIAEQEERAKLNESDSSDDGAIVNPHIGHGDNKPEDGEFEDEEIDSDEALGSDDEYDVLNSKFSQTIRDREKRKKKGQLEPEEDEAYDSIDESELLPLSAVWDIDDADLNNIKGASESKDIVLDDNWLSESEGESSEEDSSEDDDDSQDDEDNVFPIELGSDTEEVELTKLKNQLLQNEKAKTKLHFQGGNTLENEFALPGGGNDITLADMLSVVDKNSSSKAVLIDASNEENGRSLSVPLPQRIQKRQERKAAYEISKDELNKWNDTIKENRRAEVLHFPLNPETAQSTPSTFAETPALTDLEKNVQAVLKESSLLDDNNEATFEQIAVAKLSPEELHKRQNELRKMRELMFRSEREAKRIKKIKSKSFRRVKKREMLKNQQLVEGDERDTEDHDAKRALERMTLKHKNNTAWTRSLIHSGLSNDKETREEMEEMLRRGEKLRSKILGRGEGEEENLDLDAEIVEDDVNDEVRGSIGKTGVLNMAFMKNAEAREQLQNAEAKKNLRKLEEDGDIAAFSAAEANAVNVNINTGRRIYTSDAKKVNEEMTEVNKQVLDENELDNSKTLLSRLQKNKKQKNTEGERHGNNLEEENNPWLTSKAGTQKSNKINVVEKTSSKTVKSNSKINKQRKRKVNEMDVPSEEILDINQTLQIVDLHANGSEDEMGSNVKMFTQKNLIEEAFAGDDVVSQFREEKNQVAKDEGDHVEDLSLPGWGEWVGDHTKSKKKKKFRVIKGVVDSDKRKDKNKYGVIINEKLNKKNSKYLSSAVPFPYENKEQYERSLRMPLGQEWTSRETHQRLTMPKVTVKPGVVIDPLRAPFK